MSRQTTPNVIVIMCDELRHDTLSYAGDPVVRTPNIDRLAARSHAFTDHHVVSPVCAPSRHAFFTGKYPHTTNTPGGELPLPRQHRFWPALLEERGYLSAAIGKLHQTPPGATYGFSWFKNTDYPWAAAGFNAYQTWLESQGIKDLKQAFGLTDEQKALRARGLTVGWGEDPVPDPYTDTTYVANEATAFLRQPPRQPFMLHVSFKKPHSPFLSPRPWCDMYADADVPAPVVPPGDVEGKTRMVQEAVTRQRADRMTSDDWIAARKAYLGLVSYVDHHIGRIVDVLDEQGYWDNSIIIFTSDHGTMLGEHNLHGKFFHYEPSTRVPLLVHMPGQAQARRVTHSNTNIDIMPTMLEALDIPAPGGLQGRSLMPLIRGDSDAWDDGILLEHQGILRDADFSNALVHVHKKSFRLPHAKLNFTHGTPSRDEPFTTQWELYDLADDPGETRNVYDAAQYSKLRQQMLDRLAAAWAQSEVIDLSRYGESKPCNQPIPDPVD